MKKSVISVLLSIVMLFSLTVTAFAAVIEEDVARPNYTYISGTGATFDVGVFSCTCSGDVSGKSGVKKTSVKLQLQKNNDGVWKTVETWEETTVGTTGSASGSATISPLSEYRLKATFTAYTSTDSESTTRYMYE